jgi:hypothetical protein
MKEDEMHVTCGMYRIGEECVGNGQMFLREETTLKIWMEWESYFKERRRLDSSCPGYKPS